MAHHFGIISPDCTRTSVVSQSNSSRDSVDDFIRFLVGEDDVRSVGMRLPEEEVGSLVGGDTGNLEAEGILVSVEEAPGILLGVEEDPPDLVE